MKTRLYPKLNEVEVYKIKAGYYLAIVKNNGMKKRVYISFWNGRKMNEWRWSNHDLFPTKREAVLALEEVEFDLIEEMK